VSRDTVELVESAFAAWNRRDVRGFAEHVAEDVRWVEVSGRPESEGRELSGRERMRASLESLLEVWESYRIELERVEDLGDRVLLIVREIGRGRASGVEIESLWGYLVAVGDGLIVRVEAYRDAEEALRASGLSSA
jgi:uncharacterized protein (TIGR02246 family)